MLIPKQRFSEDQTVMDKNQFITSNLVMTPRDQVVRVSASPATGALTITLPLVHEMQGQTVTILARDADGTNDVTIQDNDESEDWSDIVLNGINDGVVLYSDGLKWWPIESDIAHTGTTLAPTTT